MQIDSIELIRLSPLTKREEQIMFFLSQNIADINNVTKDTAIAFGITPATVNTHFAGIFSKLQVHHVAGAIKRYNDIYKK